MKKWLQLTKERQKLIIDQVSRRTGFESNTIEKDWWVTIALKAVFHTKWAPNLVFKGGTSLSKAWNLITRFSEDVDLAIDRSVFGVEAENLSQGQISRLRKKSSAFLSGEFKDALQQALMKLGVPENALQVKMRETERSDTDPRILELQYLSLYEGDNYVSPTVLLEIGARSLKEPFRFRQIRSIIADIYPDQPFADVHFEVPAVDPQRTFWEKILLLHEEFKKPTEKMRYNRLSRHFYDLHCIMDTPHGRAALANRKLFSVIVKHRKVFSPIPNIDYANLTYGVIDLIPPPVIIDLWKEDYNRMRTTMLLQSPPNFNDIMMRMQDLRERVRSLEKEVV